MSTKTEREKAIREAAGQKLQCPVCKQWVLCVRGRLALNGHIEREHPDDWKRRQAYTEELLGGSATTGDFEDA